MVGKILILLLVGCTAVQKKASKSEFLSGNPPQGSTAESIATDLTRGENNYGYFAVEAQIYTKPFVIAKTKEESKRLLENEAGAKARMAEAEKTFLTGRTCFLFKIHTHTIDSGMFKFLVAKLEDSQGNQHDIHFLQTRGVTSVPTAAGKFGYDWFNASVGCTSKPIDITKGFKVHVNAQATSSKPSVLIWESDK
jgi:hypothetical protein